MERTQDRQGDVAGLRRRAEDRMKAKKRGLKPAAGNLPEEAERERLRQELQIHQIELELQNEELKKTRDEAEAERERYRDLYDFAPVGYFTLDRDGVIRRTNLAGARLLGPERSRLQNRRFGDFVSAADIGTFNAFLNKVFENRGRQSCDVSLGEKEQPCSHVHIEAAAAEGEEECRAAVLDWTVRKNTEAQVLGLHDKLDKESAEHIAQLEAANSELDSFSYSISHDLQAPLRAIDGYARMILRSRGDGFDEETRRRFDIIRSSAQRMGQLINDLLAFSRLGKRELAVATADMQGLITEVWEELKAANPGRTLTLRCDALPPAPGDPALLRQVIVNLLSNAVKFAQSRDEVIVEAGWHEKEKENVYTIRDNGIGFDMAYYGKLFGMFQRLHKPEDYEGTGVGLAIAQRIVLRHGGRIWAESKPDEGTCFYIALPKA